MLKIACLLMVFMGALIMTVSIIIYKRTIENYIDYLPSKNKVFNKYTSILIMMIFFLFGYIATLYLIFGLSAIDISMTLVSIIFFFGAVFCFSVVFVQSQLLSRLEMNANKLREALTDSRDNNNKLEHLNNELVKTMDALKGAQQHLIFSEKMSTLGKMMAGISHEINTPLGVIHASAQSMESSFSEQIDSLLNEIHKLSDSSINDLIKYLKISITNARENYTTSETRAMKREARSKLAKTDGFNDNIFDLLTRNELIDSDTIDSVAPLLSNESFVDLLLIVSKLHVIITSIDNITVSSNKISKIITSMKSFSHTRTDNDKTTFCVVKSIETVLSIFTNQLKYDFKVETDYESVPEVEGYEDELGQVWSNLIQNAVHAMRDANNNPLGESRNNVLRITVMNAENDNITVSISDNGSGISADRMSNIFDPFYTTKPTGIGTGLGLSISKQIVEKHCGTMQVESEEGSGATFTITLPVRASKQLDI